AAAPSAANSGANALTTTARASAGSVARYTQHIPPLDISESSVYVSPSAACSRSRSALASADRMIVYVPQWCDTAPCSSVNTPRVVELLAFPRDDVDDRVVGDHIDAVADRRCDGGNAGEWSERR